ncbi:MAG: universal stress protein [Candidatus Ozemobacteraceae bacterium]
MFKRILVPLDGSALAESVLPVAVYFADVWKAQIILLHVIERNAPGSIHGDRHLSRPDEAEAYLKEITRTTFPSRSDVARHVHEENVTDVAESLVGHSEEFSPDLVLLCAHGEGSWRDWIYGNIAQQIVDLGETPVLLIKPGKSGKSENPEKPEKLEKTEKFGSPGFPFKKILAPIDGKPEHEIGLPGAEVLAGMFGADMRLIMVVPTISTLSGSEAIMQSMFSGSTFEVLELAQEQAVAYLGERVTQFQEKGISVSACVARGDPRDRIIGEANRWGADLVVLGTHGKAGLRAFWSGSLASKLLSRLSCSFLLIPASEKDQSL